MSSGTAPGGRLGFGWLPGTIFRASCSNFWDMWEEKTMRKHGRGRQNQALQTFGPNSASDQILSDFGEQIGANCSSKIEQTSIKNRLKN